MEKKVFSDKTQKIISQDKGSIPKKTTFEMCLKQTELNPISCRFNVDPKF